jgi:beta-lactamase superfamily II metal-dependent hydrolase
MDIITVNVGQRSLTIVRHNGEAIIIDSRIPPSGDSTVAYVKGVLASFLKDNNVIGIILTGFDKDHSDAIGVKLVLNKYRPDWILYPKYYKDTDAASDVFKVIGDFYDECCKAGKKFQRVSVSLDKTPDLNSFNLSKQFDMKLFSPDLDDMSNSNNSSVVLQLKGKGQNGFSYLVTGDTENSRWSTINKKFGGNLKSDVMAAPHHGSIHSTNAETILLVEPQMVLISAGVDNQYGHPDSQVVSAYSKVAKVYSTNIPDGGSLFTTKRNGAINTTRFD